MSHFKHLMAKKFSETYRIVHNSSFRNQFDVDIVIFGFYGEFIQIFEDIIIENSCSTEIQFQKSILWKSVQSFYDRTAIHKGHFFGQIHMIKILLSLEFFNQHLM